MPSKALAFGKALADETRQKIMRLLCCREMCVSELVSELGNVSQPTVSHHLQILKSANLVDTRREGKQVYYTLRQAAIADCCCVIAREYAPGVDLVSAELPTETRSRNRSMTAR
ncbi:MAG: winged helix-turn-helix transcriptional regulator [Thermoflexales bacterium]|nr:winged helix-turn-helix transcriptional regulator [Thermoflexales bacterium]